MRNLKLQIEYNGTNYCGWQVQNSHSQKSIQEVIEKTLQKILQEKLRIIASGRTDAGVHALCQVVNFKTESKISKEKLQRALNGLLPKDIVITKVQEKPLNFHSRYSAKSKVYRYCILNRSYPSALLRNSVYFYHSPLDLDLMHRASRYLLGRHDFKTFCASGSNVKNTIRTIKGITIKKSVEDKSLIIIDMEADGFLYNMVRNIVGTLIEIGKGRLSVESLKKILVCRNRKLAGPTAPAQGLYLLRVKY